MDLPAKTGVPSHSNRHAKSRDGVYTLLFEPLGETPPASSLRLAGTNRRVAHRPFDFRDSLSLDSTSHRHGVKEKLRLASWS